MTHEYPDSGSTKLIWIPSQQWVFLCPSDFSYDVSTARGSAPGGLLRESPAVRAPVPRRGVVAQATAALSSSSTHRPRPPAAPAAVDADGYGVQEVSWVMSHPLLCWTCIRILRLPNVKKLVVGVFRFASLSYFTFLPLSDLTASTRVTVRANTLAPGACWRPQDTPGGRSIISTTWSLSSLSYIFIHCKIENKSEWH